MLCGQGPPGQTPGSYLLVIRLPKKTTVTIGRLGVFTFPAGYYVYCGSARNGLRGRIARHQRTKKKLHWHIDYLLMDGAARLIEAWAFPGDRTTECDLVSALLAQAGARPHPPGFGASDCRRRCPAHLIFFRKKPSVRRVFPAAVYG